MLDTTTSATQASIQRDSAPQRRPNQVLRMTTNDRMAGSVPVWERPSSAKDTVAQTLASAGRDDRTTFDNALSYADSGDRSGAGDNEAFGFGDLVDMVNPLQQLPIIGSIYRGITGDTIKPVSRVIGGAIYGGFAGAGGALVNVVIEEETGKDIVGNVVSLVTDDNRRENGRKPSAPSAALPPVERLSRAVRAAEESVTESLPGSTISFVDMGGGKRRIYEQYRNNDSRMAGTAVKISTGVLAERPPREPITRVALAAMPAFND